MFDKKEYDKKYYLAHRQAKIESSKKYYVEHELAVKECRNAYHRKYDRYGEMIYVGVVSSCPRCGKRGYKRYVWYKNTKTGVLHTCKTYISHQHSVRVNGKVKTIQDGMCYIGVGQL